MSSLEKCLFRSPDCFLIALLVFVFVFDIELYELFDILEINPLLVTSFANVLSQSIGCLFTLFMASFAVQSF